MVENYSLFPLNFWKTITYDKLEKDRPIRLGTCYQDCVNDILENDVFKGEDFKRETMKYGVIKDRGISPDFYVQNIDTEKFKNIIKERQYMFKMKYTIPSQIKKINVIGEAKISKSRSRKEHQEGDYLKFAKSKSDLETLYVLMYIFDKSYKEYYSSILSDELPIIYGYVPKLYKEDCFTHYNYIKVRVNNEKLEKKKILMNS